MAPKKHVFERFLAGRYFSGGQGRVSGSRFVRFVIVVATGGVAVGVAALLLALAITRGFSQEIERKIMDFSSHIQVESFLDAPLSNSEDYEQRLHTIRGVSTVEPAVVEFALIRTRTDIDGIAIWGSRHASVLDGYLLRGDFLPTDSASGRAGIVISQSQSELLNADIGSLVTCFSMRRNRESGDRQDIIFTRPRVQQFVVTGIYDTGFLEIDDRFAFVDIGIARKLLGYSDDQTTRFDIRVDDVAEADSVLARIENQIGFPTLSRTVYEVHRNLFAWVGLQESIIPLIISIIIIVAAFNIVGALLMLVLDKTGEIGILQSMGASAGQVRASFLWLGLLIGGVGVLLGEGISLGLAILQIRYGIIPLPRDTYYMDTAPVALAAVDFGLVAVVALALCLLAAWAPARIASSIDPIRTIRFAA